MSKKSRTRLIRLTEVGTDLTLYAVRSHIICFTRIDDRTVIRFVGGTNATVKEDILGVFDKVFSATKDQAP